MNHRRRRKPFVGCCTMCCLEVAAAIGEREQRACCNVYPCPWCGERHDDGYCVASGIGDAVCSTPGYPDCGKPVGDSAPVEPLHAAIGERLAA